MNASVCKLWQTSPHNVKPSGQEKPTGRQEPLRHSQGPGYVEFGTQTLPQLPQLSASLNRSVHPLPQSVVPATQPGAGPTAVHWPSMHWVPQRLPQKPQLLRSVLVSTQAAPHGVCPSGQETHVPAEQIPPGHAVSQFPQ